MGEIDQNNKKACKAAKVPILKLCCVLLGYMVVHIGWFGYFHSKFGNMLTDSEGSYEACKKSIATTDQPACPYYAGFLEGIFIYMTVVFLIFSVVSLVMGLVCTIPGSKIQFHDMVLHLFGAGGLCLGGILMISSAILIQRFQNPKGLSGTEISQRNRIDQYLEKIVAGIFCFLNGILYAVTAFFILKDGGEKGVTLLRRSLGFEIPASVGAVDPPRSSMSSTSNKKKTEVDVEAAKDPNATAKVEVQQTTSKTKP